MSEIKYGSTDEGRLLYDLAFTNLSPEYIARKHRKPVAEIRRLRNNQSIKTLRRQVQRDRARSYAS